MGDQSLIDEFNKSSVELVKVHLSQWRNQDYIDIRIWIASNPPEQSSELPTKKGIRISVDFLPRLIESLQKAQEVLNEGTEQRSESPQERRSQRG